MKGEISVIFDSDPLYSIEVMSYSTIGHITKENFTEFLNHFPKMKEWLRHLILPSDFSGA